MAKTEFQNEVVNRIRLLRIKHDISQIGLADIIEVSSGQIGNIESPKFQHKYTLRQLYLIAQHFKVSVPFLLTGMEELTTEQLIKTLIQYE